MNTALDAQMGDLAWSIATGLRAGYNLREVVGALVGEAPEPTASALRQLKSELDKGLEREFALAAWQVSLPSPALARLASALALHGQVDYGLPPLLDVLSEDLMHQFGSDPAFYKAMRQEAVQLGAEIPARAAG